jgi:adenosylcobinamide kinase / adenosylcobinamide-phosphate guanylyltransferase
LAESGEARETVGITLVLGGARSGKSRFAESLVSESGLAPVYIATGQALDDEMRRRIASHKMRRGEQWRTVEEPVALAEALLRESGPESVVLVDCLTLWISNLMMENADIGEAIDRLVRSLTDLSCAMILVANEVGLGIVPENRMAREFRDHAGVLNQRIAAIARQVYLVTAGIPMRIKSN